MVSALILMVFSNAVRFSSVVACYRSWRAKDAFIKATEATTVLFQGYVQQLHFKKKKKKLLR